MNSMSLSKGTDKFDRSLIDKIKEEKLDDITITPSHLRLYLKDYSDIPGFRPYFGASQDVINELEVMGIKTIKQLDEIVKPNFKEKYKENSETSDHVTLTSIIRDILIIHDAKEYTKKAYKPDYCNTWDHHFYKVFKAFNIDIKDLPQNVVWD